MLSFIIPLVTSTVLYVDYKPVNENPEEPCEILVYEGHAECEVREDIIECVTTDLHTGETALTVCAMDGNGKTICVDSHE